MKVVNVSGMDAIELSDDVGGVVIECIVQGQSRSISSKRRKIMKKSTFCQSVGSVAICSIAITMGKNASNYYRN